MTTPSFTVTDDGIETPRLQDARDLVVTQWKAEFGSNSQTASDSPNGQIIDVLSLVFLLGWQGIVAVYGSAFFRSASGVQLDRLLDPFGIARLAAQPSSVTLFYYGNNTTNVPLASVVSADGTASQWITQAPTQTTDAVRVVTLALFVAGDYEVTIDATTYSVTAPIPAADLDSVLASLASQIDSGEGVGTVGANVTRGTDGAILFTLTNMAGRTVSVNHTVDPAAIDVGFAAQVLALASTDGATVGVAGTISTPLVAIPNIDGVITFTDAILGRLTETDEELRQRWLGLLTIAGRATPDRIRAAVLAVDGVEFARVFENESNVVDIDGRPPHSFEVVVLGGADDPIAQAIWDNKPAGIQSYGTNDSGTAIDSQGIPRIMQFSRPVEQYLWLDITVTAGEGFPTTGDSAAAIVAAVATWAASTLTVGSDLYRIQVAGVCTATVPGIAAVTVLTDATPTTVGPPVFAASDIVVSDASILIGDSTRITVTII